MAFASLIMLAACQDRTVSTCERFLKEQLRSPSTYNRVSLAIEDVPAKISDFHAETGIEQRNLERAAEKGLSIRHVTIEYDADNAFGVSVRNSETCLFRLAGGEPEDQDLLDIRLDSAELEASIQRDEASGLLARQGYESLPGARSQHPCCLR